MISVTVDCVVVTRDLTQVLLIKRLNDPFRGKWALPGGFVDEDDKSLVKAAQRELFEETRLVLDAGESLYQIGTWGSKERDPRGWTVTTAYLALVDKPRPVEAKDDAAAVEWWKLPETLHLLPEMCPLAFDHMEIINRALMKAQI